ncbi:NADP-specific glutamate dehydrogenase [Fundicoccus culcitae]|uniref:Glutamate dehydrogenase n=1 Tax=Fundicoccus culcitae TaxID=2969821 RepID=A0ABY5P7A7_9LACT|nr:NADP-specific glutamate dehydrogenase [Fundicoccus culcitae]UUX34260.1 NADP-specific glutamate dehydrogenase [Fundicoccus culcitae]
MENAYTKSVFEKLSASNAHETEFLQAVEAFLEAIEVVIDEDDTYQQHAILERMVEPERIITFQVPWVDDNNQIQINKGYRVQFNSANGPYKGGLRFHPTVTQSVLKFLAFEQIFKNSLTNLPIGGGKGGSDFDPKGRSDNEIMRFCHSFMLELTKYVGSDYDVPSGDIGVGQRELSYLYGTYKKLQGPHLGVFTGKPTNLYGSFGRTEATGYGLIYFLNEMLAVTNESLVGKKVIISGSGNVAYYAAKKVQELGGIVISMSDSNATVYNLAGIDLDAIKALKIDHSDRIVNYQIKDEVTKIEEKSVWDIDLEADIALPCATQNEINEDQAKRLIKNGVKFVAEGANMPTHSNGIKVFKEAAIYYAPGKASNAGGVAVSALEMSQNAQRLQWTTEDVDRQLQGIMKQIFVQCQQACEDYKLGFDYAAGADIASFKKVAKQMIQLGIY